MRPAIFWVSLVVGIYLLWKGEGWGNLFVGIWFGAMARRTETWIRIRRSK